MAGRLRVWGWLGAVTAVGLALRGAYTWAMQVGPHDPWRHLLLVDRLRDGSGFSLFADQPYLWYPPVWYRLCAVLPEKIGPEWPAALLSALCVPLIYGWGRVWSAASAEDAAVDSSSGGGQANAWGTARRRGHRVGGLAAMLMAAFGPVVFYTCHYGSEALALCCLLAALGLVVASAAPPPLTWAPAAARPLVVCACAGALFGLGLVVRLNLVLAVPLLLLPLLASPWWKRLPSFAVGAAMPLVWMAWRNQRIIDAYDWVFTWDGLATPTAEFNWLSTVLLQWHPDVAVGLARLHAAFLPQPEWRTQPVLGAWVGLAAIAALARLLVDRRFDLALGLLPGVVYLAWFESSGSSSLFRTWLPLFPAMLLAVAWAAARLAAVSTGAIGTARLVAAMLLVVALPLGGLPALRPPSGAIPVLGNRPIPLEMASPPGELLDEQAYMVNSTFFPSGERDVPLPRSSLHRLASGAAGLSRFCRGVPRLSGDPVASRRGPRRPAALARRRGRMDGAWPGSQRLRYRLPRAKAGAGRNVA